MLKQHLLHTLRLFAAAGVASLVVGCASVAVSDDAIERNTAVAIGLDVGSFSITDRVDEGIKTSYTVKTNAGEKYFCYVTGTVSVIGRTVSDAMCNRVGKSAKQNSGGGTASCNALLKAAGKCK